MTQTLTKFSQLTKCRLHSDGEFGELRGFFFDDQQWPDALFRRGRQLVAEWPPRAHRVPPVFTNVDMERGVITARLTREQVWNPPQVAPEFDPQPPLTREGEERLHAHYTHEGAGT